MAAQSTKFQRGFMTSLLTMPEPMLRLMSGWKRVLIDGNVLDASTQAMLAMAKRAQAPFTAAVSPAEMRAEYRRTAALLSIEPDHSVRAEDLRMETPVGVIPARLYTPPNAGACDPALVYYHGGGWVIGDLEVFDGPCRQMAREAGVKVISVDYRLAPEHRFPAAVEDAVAAFRFVRQHAERLGIDGRRIAVGGDSAGGNLAAVVAQETKRAGEPGPAFQWLLYPGVDMVDRYPSNTYFADGFFLTQPMMEWFQAHYVAASQDPADPRLSPLRAPSLEGLPPAHVVTAGFDPLRDQGKAYYEALRKAGVPASYECESALIHGFINLGALPVMRAAASRAIARLRDGLARSVETKAAA